MAPNGRPIPPELVRHLEDELRRSFQIQLDSEVTFKPGVPSAEIDTAITSILSMASTKESGVLAFLFPKETYCAIFGKLVGETVAEISEENADGAAEILNIVYGAARKKINEAGHDFQPAIPTVVCGSDVHISHGLNSSFVALTCESDLGRFRVEFSLKLAA